MTHLGFQNHHKRMYYQAKYSKANSKAKIRLAGLQEKHSKAQVRNPPQDLDRFPTNLGLISLPSSHSKAPILKLHSLDLDHFLVNLSCANLQVRHGTGLAMVHLREQNDCSQICFQLNHNKAKLLISLSLPINHYQAQVLKLQSLDMDPFVVILRWNNLQVGHNPPLTRLGTQNHRDYSRPIHLKAHKLASQINSSRAHAQASSSREVYQIDHKITYTRIGINSKTYLRLNSKVLPKTSPNRIKLT